MLEVEPTGLHQASQGSDIVPMGSTLSWMMGRKNQVYSCLYLKKCRESYEII